MQRIAMFDVWIAALITFLLFSAPVNAQGEHNKRLSTVLLVLRGDARIFTSLPPPLSEHGIGLQQRIRGELASLSLLIRLADQESNKKGNHAESTVQELRLAFDEQRFFKFTGSLSTLISNYPLSLSSLLASPDSSSQMQLAKQLHQTHCAACHDKPNLRTERPAYNLFAQAKNQPSPEFAARMLMGVRGDNMTGIGNPLSDGEIAALISFYRSSIVE